MTILAISFPTVASPIHIPQQTTQVSASTLVPDLLHDRKSVRDQTLAELKASGHAVATLEQALQSPNWQVRVIAAYHLGEIGPAANAAVQTLAASLTDQHTDVRFSAAQALGKIGSGAANSNLLTTLEDPEDAVRIAATDALLRLIETIDSQEQLSILRKMLIEDTSTYHYVSTNAQFRDKTPLSAPEIAVAMQEQSAENLVQALGHRNWFIRQTAARKLEELLATDDRMVRQLLPAVRWVKHGYARSVIAELLANLDRNRLESLARSRNDQLGLIYLLGVSGSNEVVPELLQYLRSSDYSYVSEAASALGQIGTSDAMAAIVQETGINNPYAFAGRRSEVLTQEFYRRLTSQDRSTRQGVLDLTSFGLDASPNVVDAIRQVPTEQALEILVPELNSGLEDPDYDYPRIRAGAVSLLEPLPQDAVLTAISEYLSPIESFAVFYEMRGFVQELFLDNSDLVNRVVRVSRELLSELQKDPEQQSHRSDLWWLIKILTYLAQVGSIEARAGLLELMVYGETFIKVHDLQTVFSLADLGYPPEMEAALAKAFWEKYDESDDIVFQLKIMDVLDDYSLKRVLIPALQEQYSDLELSDRDIEELRQHILGIIRQNAINAFLGISPYSEIQDINIHQIQGLSINIKNHSSLIFESLERPKETYVWEGSWQGLSHARAVQLLALDSEHVEQAVDAAFNLLDRHSWRFHEDGADVQYAIDVLLETLETASSYSGNYQSILAEALELSYEDSPALQIALQNKHADYRRIIVLAIGQQKMVSDADIKVLWKTLRNNNENQQVRWTAAAILHRLGHNTDGFFLTHRLPHPRLLRSSLCRYDSLSVGIWLSMDPIPTDEELLYFGRCTYGFNEEGGGDWPGIYRTIKELLGRAFEGDSQ